jgi:hypothetical protein
MRTPDSCEIPVLTVPEKAETLVNENIMHEKISKPINCNTETDPEKEIIIALHSQEQTDNTRYGKDQKEEIVVLEKSRRLFVMMVFVQYPKDAMHDIFMREPGNSFHGKKSRKGYQYFSKHHNDSFKVFI